jgi:hypothetical protein
MADFFSVALDLDGAMRIAFNDTTSQHHGAHLFEARQVAGPGALGGTISRTVPTNPVSDPVGDAQWPHYSPAGAGPNLAQFDLTQVRLSQPDSATLRVEMSLSSLASLAPPPGKTSSLWLTRFQALSLGDQGEEAYRIFYVGAESVGGGPPAFFAGSGSAAQGSVPGTGCTITTAENCKIVQYPAEVSAPGSINGDVITLDVTLDGGFGSGRPILSGTLFNVTALTAGRNNASTDIYADIDATASFDYTFSCNPPPPPGSGRNVTGGGAIAGTGDSDAPFTLNVKDILKGKIAYRDPGAGVRFRSTRILSVTFNDADHSVRITGTGVNGDRMVDFAVVAIDNGEPGTNDRFSISLSGGYSKSGTLRRGNIKIH